MPTQKQLTVQKVGQFVMPRMGNQADATFPMDVLIFVNDYNRKIPLIARGTLDNVVRQFFRLTKNHQSAYRSTKDIQCRNGAYRSAWDIWRHVVDVRPNATLFDVMGSLVRLSPELRIQYCPTVNKRVFYPYTWIVNGRAFLHDATLVDEMGLTFDEWRLFA